MENKMFCVLFEMDLHMVIHQRLRLSPAQFSEYHDVVNFKANFENVYICANKDLTEGWYALPYMVVEYNILVIINKWSSNFSAQLT